MEILITGIIIYIEMQLFIRCSFRLAQHYDAEYELNITSRVSIGITLGCGAAVIGIMTCLPHFSRIEKLGGGILAAYLITAVIMDVQTLKIYDFLHPAAAGVGMLLLLHKNTEAEAYISLLLYGLIQYAIFTRMYGKADGKAFFTCAVYQSLYHHGLFTYLLHMAAVFLLLAVVQIKKKNLNRKGSLKQPVPLLPYIAACAVLFL